MLQWTPQTPNYPSSSPVHMPHVTCVMGILRSAMHWNPIVILGQDKTILHYLQILHCYFLNPRQSKRYRFIASWGVFTASLPHPLSVSLPAAAAISHSVTPGISFWHSQTHDTSVMRSHPGKLYSVTNSSPANIIYSTQYSCDTLSSVISKCLNLCLWEQWIKTHPYFLKGSEKWLYLF